MRVENWEHILNEFIDANKNNKFKYGTWDCCIFTAGAVRAITGENYLKPFKYKSKKKAFELIEKAGGIIKILSDRFEERQTPYLSQRGDIVYYKQAIGICLGAKAIFVNESGYSFVHMDDWERVYKV